MHGYHNRYFRIDVGDDSLTQVALSDELLTKCIGGVGLAAAILLNEQAADFDPFDPRSTLVLSFSPLVGTPLTTSAKFAVAGKSPLTDRFCDSLSSSHFALAGKRTGADAIVVTGRAESWKALVIDEDSISSLNASDLIGKSARETETMLRSRIGPEYQIMAIGPAAENLVPYSGISHDGRHAGRGGLGAILGSKRIKAIAVRGNQRTSIADTQRVVALARDLSARSFGPATEKYRELGTIANLLTFNRLAVLPTNNFRESSFVQAEAISGESLATLADKTRKSCASCTIGCEHIFPTAAGGSVRIEYETLFALGSLCGIGDRDVILQAAAECDRVGIDTVSFGATFAFACECVERGWLAAPTDVDLQFGNSAGLLTAIGLVASRKGTGELLAMGSRRLAERIGPEAVAIAPHVKGLEIPGYDPAKLPMAALGFAVNPRGADHNRSGGYEVDFSGHTDCKSPTRADVGKLIDAENRAALLDSMILCKFVRGVFTDLFTESAELLSAVTGFDHSAASLICAANHVIRLKRQFNERAGWTESEDTLPSRFLRSLESTGRADAVFDRALLHDLRGEYYRLRGLNELGRLEISQGSLA